MRPAAITQTSQEKYFTSAVIADAGGAAAMVTRANGARAAKKDS
jgi:hypothetical protein